MFYVGKSTIKIKVLKSPSVVLGPVGDKCVILIMNADR